MLEDGLTKAVEGLGSNDPVKTLLGVIILCLIGWFFTYRIMNGLRLEEREGRLKAEADREKDRAEQREDYRNMHNVTKALEDLQSVVRDISRK